MASRQHDFIVASIARKMRADGFTIIYLDGKYQDIDIRKIELPPKIINHKPDIIGEKDDRVFCIGETKTRNDLNSIRTKTQISDFLALVSLNSPNKLIIGIPLNAKIKLEKILSKLQISNPTQLDILYIPETLLPDEEAI